MENEFKNRKVHLGLPQQRFKCLCKTFNIRSLLCCESPDIAMEQNQLFLEFFYSHFQYEIQTKSFNSPEIMKAI